MKLRFVGYTGFYAFEIRRVSQGFWATHAECEIDGKLIGARSYGVSVAEPGYDKGTFECELYVELEATSEQDAAFTEFVKAQVGKPYDKAAIFAMAEAFVTTRQRDWRSPDSWFCAELMCAALEHCGWLRPIATAVNHITPRDLVLVCSARHTSGNWAPAVL